MAIEAAARPGPCGLGNGAEPPEPRSLPLAAGSKDAIDNDSQFGYLLVTEAVRGGASVYICVCNALNERKVDEAIGAGARSVAGIYKCHGCTPKCGRCIPMMRERLQGATAGADEARSAAA